jgi:hypothetical protein
MILEGDIMRHLKIFKVYASVVLFFTITNSYAATHNNPNAWTTDRRHIVQSWPQKTVTWLRFHEAPCDLKYRIDAVLQREDVITLLSSIYQRGYLYPEEKEALNDAGITFFYFKMNIFQIKQIPGYIFKMACPPTGHNELLNIGRLEQADKIRAIIHKWGLEKSIIIPQKYAYIMPKIESIPYEEQPKVIIVAQKIDLTGKEQRRFHHILAKAWLKLHGVPDLVDRNMRYLQNNLALIDTEPQWMATPVPGFSDIVTIVRRPGPEGLIQGKHEYIPAHNTICPTKMHNILGQWKCITPQGLIVQSPRLACINCWCKNKLH